MATTQYFYNASGNMYQMIDANSKTTDYSYDLRNRRLTATDLLGQITRWTYDGVGSVLTVTRPAPVGGVTVNTYDTMNRLSTTTDPASQLTQYFYGGLNYVGGTKGDNLVRLKDARLNSHDFTYDAMNRKTSMIYPGGSHEDWGYDNVGNNNTYKNRAALTKTISYDTRNRETGFTWSDGSTPAVARTYDNASRLLTLNNANSALTYTYDFSGQLTGETQNVSGLGAKTVGYSYDADGNRATMTYPGGKVAGYTYTGRNQVDTITYDGPPPLVNYDYDLAGNRSLKTLENGTRTAYAYDDAERLTGVDHQRSSGGAWTSFQSFGYTLSSVGNRTDRYETNAGLTKRDKYSYLADDQLDIVKYNYTGTTQDRTVDYNYDAVGSRTTVADSAGQTPGTYAPNTLNQYTSVNGAGQGFDSNGNQTMVYLGSGSSPSYFTYDAQNRATSGYGMVPGGYNSMSLAYDARNRCVKRTSSGSSGMTTTYLVWDGWNLLAEFAGGSGYSYPPPPATELRRYVHGAAVDEILLAIAPSAAQTVHHVHDGLGNVTALTDAGGNAVERYTYDVFGAATVLNASGTVLTASAYGNRFLFTGREWIAELAVYDYRNRIYSASLGRFLQTDQAIQNIETSLNEWLKREMAHLSVQFPRELAQVVMDVYDPGVEEYYPQDSSGLTHYVARLYENLYSYAFNSPGKYIDPEGLRSTPPGTKQNRCKGGKSKEVLDNKCTAPNPIGAILDCWGKKCCLEHDKCFDKNDCNSLSWFWPICGSAACRNCNAKAVACFLTGGNLTH